MSPSNTDNEVCPGCQCHLCVVDAAKVRTAKEGEEITCHNCGAKLKKTAKGLVLVSRKGR